MLFFYKKIEKKNSLISWEAEMLTTAWIPSFFLCWFDWKTGTLLVRNASFHCSRTVQLVPTFSHVPPCIFRTIARAHCTAHRHTSRPTRCHVTICIHGCSPEWTSLAWLEKGDLTRWTDRGVVKNVKGREDWTLCWI